MPATIANYEQAFLRFSTQPAFLRALPFDVSTDDPGVRAVIPHMTRRVVSYGRHASTLIIALARSRLVACKLPSV